MPDIKIYLDMCCYNRPFDDQSQMRVRLETEAKLFVQSAIRQKRISLAWSYMLDYENSENPNGETKNAIAVWKAIAVDHCPSSDEVLAAGRGIMKHGINAKDALHIACAIRCGCERFITTDRKLINKTVPGIKIANPMSFAVEIEELT